MIPATTIEIIAGRPKAKEIRHFVVNIYQEVNGMNNPKKRNVRLALEAFSNYLDGGMDGMVDVSFMVFYKGMCLPEEFEVPTVSGSGLMEEALAEGAEFRVKDIEAYERTSAGSLFLPDFNSLAVKQVSFEQALWRADAILANNKMGALLGLRMFKTSQDEWDMRS